MGERVSGPPPGAEPPDRRGWHMPGESGANAAEGPGTRGDQNVDHDRTGASLPTPRGVTAPQMAPSGCVIGLARDVTVGSANGNEGTVVTFRLEQHDPRAGRTGVVPVRLFGQGAIGFVSVGDWVEVSGKSKHGFINPSQAFNHTSQASYARPGQGWAKVAKIAFIVLVILFILFIWVVIGVNVVRDW